MSLVNNKLLSIMQFSIPKPENETSDQTMILELMKKRKEEYNEMLDMLNTDQIQNHYDFVFKSNRRKGLPEKKEKDE